MRPLILAVLLALPAQAKEVRLTGVEIAQTLERAFSGTTAHLDGDVVGKDGKPVQRSFIQLPEALGGERHFFSLSDQLIDLGAAGQATYRVRDINLERISVAAREGEFVASFHFEDEGVELVGKHAGGFMDLGGAVPDMQMDKMRLDVSLRPKHGGERPKVERAKVRFFADIRPAGGASPLLDNGLLDETTRYKDRIRDEIEKQANETLASPEVLGALNDRLWQELGARAGGKLKSARFDGVDLVLAPAAP